MSIQGIYGSSQISNNYSSSAYRIGSPNWDQIPHKGMERPTNAEFDVIIDDLAKALAEAKYNKNDNKYKSLSAIAEKTRAQYISAASPDRKALAQEAMQAYKKGPNSSKKAIDEPKTLIDYLNMRDGIGTSSGEGRYSIALKSGSMVFTGSDLEPSTFTLKSGSSGQAVLSHSKNGWAYILTPQEQAMHSDFLNRLNAKENQYYGQYLGSSMQMSSNDGNYNSTYESSRIDFRA